MTVRRWAAVLLACAWTIPQGARAAEPLNVVVTIKPVHSLAASVMEGLGTPLLLIKGGGSAHNYALRPSEARAISKADIVVRVSENLETFLEKPLATLPKRAKLVTLAESPGMTLLPPREGGAFEAHAHHGHGHGHKHGHAHGDHAEAEEEHDPHLWLNPANAAAITDALAAAFAQARPTEGERFRANAAKLKERLAALDAELKAATVPLKGKNFIVFHDAYQYFEAAYGIQAAGSITLSPERQPGAARLKQIRARIMDLESVCVFSEPQFPPKLVATVTEGTAALTGSLDPLGAAQDEGPEQYFQLLRGLAADLGKCLG